MIYLVGPCDIYISLFDSVIDALLFLPLSLASTLLMLAALGVTDPFDRHHRLVSSPLYSPRTLALQRLALVVYGAASLITSLVYESVVLHQGHMYVLYN
jgi:hypothetical protein